ncbi:MAG: sulfotransferase domain-containing protein [Chloroflexi bacterium]|nr:sulfotransferase domain-containing protein [Chloroflexota bacterium]
MGKSSALLTFTVKNTSTIKHILKQVRWQARRASVARRYGSAALRAAPIVFGNAMPKSGSHLLTQVLEGLTQLGPFVDPGFPPVNRSEGNQPLSPERVLANVRAMRPGDIRYGYIHAREPYLSLFAAPDRATVFIYRDPRDMLVSHVFYATDMYAGHGMHRYYTEVLTTMEERLNAAIEGVTEPGFELSSVSQRYDSYVDWLDHPEVLCLRFEDLILDRDAALGRLLDYLETRGFTAPVPRPQAVATLATGIAPRKSGTFRKGQPGNWREHFTDANKSRFEAVAGGLLVRLGYEESNDW